MTNMAIDKKVQKAMARYEEIKLQIKELEEEADELKPEILAQVPVDVEIEGEHGIFTIQRRPTWTYSNHHKQVKEQLKGIEADEKAKGIAKAVFNEILVYTVSK